MAVPIVTKTKVSVLSEVYVATQFANMEIVKRQNN